MIIIQKLLFSYHHTQVDVFVDPGPSDDVQPVGAYMEYNILHRFSFLAFVLLNVTILNILKHQTLCIRTNSGHRVLYALILIEGLVRFDHTTFIKIVPDNLLVIRSWMAGMCECNYVYRAEELHRMDVVDL